ncbi:BBE domain-containing protein [Algoriphagus sp. D3-2-R+10]
MTKVRLTEIKAKYDPSNLFRINQNIKPLWEENAA